MESLLLLRFDQRDLSPDELDEAARRLRLELLDLGVESAEVPRSAGPSGAKGDAFTYGALAIAVLPTLLPTLVEFLRGYVGRGSHGSLKVKLQDGDKAVEVEVDGQAESAEHLLRLATKALKARQVGQTN